MLKPQQLQLTSIVATILLAAPCYSFMIQHEQRILTNSRIKSPPIISTPKMALLPDISPPSLSSSSTVNLASSAIQLTYSASSALSTVDPLLEAEFFSDAAHVALDLTTFCWGPGTIALRLFAVLGRIFVIVSDYIPDHSMKPDEFMFQFLMLSFSSVALAQSLASVTKAYRRPLTIRDMKCFVSLFHPIGLSYLQYKMLAASGIFEWEDIEANDVIAVRANNNNHNNDSYLYWVYRGVVIVRSLSVDEERKDDILQRIAPRSQDLFGDLDFTTATNDNNNNNARVTKTSRRKNYVQKINSSHNPTVKIKKSSTITYRAGSEGVTVLRINTSKLSKLMEQDSTIDKAIRDIIMQSMRSRIEVLLENTE